LLHRCIQVLIPSYIILLYFYIIYIYTEDDKTRCLEAYCQLLGKTIDSGKCPYLDQIKTIEFTFQEARGPSYGRHLQEYLLEDEEFCMEIDSHTDFIKNWFTNILLLLLSIRSLLLLLLII